MKNVKLVISSLLLCVLMCQNMTATGNIVSHRDVVDCVRSSGTTWRKLKRVHDLETTPEGREELVKDKSNFRDYGCFLGCIWKMDKTDKSATMFEDAIIIEDIQRSFGNSSDVELAVTKAITACAEIVGEEEDDCLMVLDLKLCIIENMRDIS